MCRALVQLVCTRVDVVLLLLTQGYRKRHMNVLGPAITPTVANAIVTQVGLFWGQVCKVCSSLLVAARLFAIC